MLQVAFVSEIPRPEPEAMETYDVPAIPAVIQGLRFVAFSQPLFRAWEIFRRPNRMADAFA
jgi:hypothetical protein